ncbi:hypothetical protein [Parasediminibacterium sp. JCM 36343]|uniref:hypothetical protein n=1 Tax=Parasediminibacterium sp. JCM 36343 TaxID=3374279 RepID=UPI003979848D
MFSEGQLLYFTPFNFKNGDEPANKFFIVLKNVDGNTIVASLPTSKPNPPALIDITHGCINKDERMFNCYLFGAGKKVCKNGFCFELNTHVYGNQINAYNEKDFTKDNERCVEGVHYFVKGELTELELKSLLDCIRNSKSIKNKIKKYFPS